MITYRFWKKTDKESPGKIFIKMRKIIVKKYLVNQ